MGRIMSPPNLSVDTVTPNTPEDDFIGQEDLFRLKWGHWDEVLVQ